MPRLPLRLHPSLVVRSTVLLAAWLAYSAGAAAQAAPAPDVFLASLVVGGAELRVGAPRNITARSGYDNQPAFSLDGRHLFFTSTRDDAQADIYRFTLSTGVTTRVTTSAPESEYSATELPGGGALGVIRVERDSTQRLWRIPLAGGREAPLFPTLKPVGYHAWADSMRAVMFVLGSPAMLVLGDLRTGALDTVSANVGRSLHRIPGGTHLSFVSKAYENAPWIMDLDPDSRHVRPLVKLPAGTEDYAWLPDGRLIAGSGSVLLLCNLSSDAAWTAITDLAPLGVTSISRLAVSPAGDQLAIVAIPTRP